MNTFDLDRLMITEDSFGSNLPRNWEAIAARLNCEIFDKIVTAGIEDPQEAYEIASSIWEDYCSSSDDDDEEEESTMEGPFIPFRDRYGRGTVVSQYPGILDWKEFNRVDPFGVEGPDYYEQRIADGWIDFYEGWTLVIADVTPVDAMLSLDNGNSYMTVDELEDCREVILDNWDVITSYMDDEVRESVTGIYDKIEFLARYLRRSRHDLVIG